jgi:hypothetical protein
MRNFLEERLLLMKKWKKEKVRRKENSPKESEAEDSAAVPDKI